MTNSIKPMGKTEISTSINEVSTYTAFDWNKLKTNQTILPYSVDPKSGKSVEKSEPSSLNTITQTKIYKIF